MPNEVVSYIWPSYVVLFRYPIVVVDVVVCPSELVCRDRVNILCSVLTERDLAQECRYL